MLIGFILVAVGAALMFFLGGAFFAVLGYTILIIGGVIVGNSLLKDMLPPRHGE